MTNEGVRSTSTRTWPPTTSYCWPRIRFPSSCCSLGRWQRRRTISPLGTRHSIVDPDCGSLGPDRSGTPTGPPGRIPSSSHQPPPVLSLSSRLKDPTPLRQTAKHRVECVGPWKERVVARQWTRGVQAEGERRHDGRRRDRVVRDSDTRLGRVEYRKKRGGRTEKEV